MKKAIISTLTVFIVLFSVIFVPEITSDGKKGLLILENDGLSTPPEIIFEEANPQYVLNLSSKKYHKKDCKFASNISDGNYYKTSDMNYIVTRGYTKCSVCFKDN